tara:strand:- start:344 stop:490 length:147 start_codon:yes stop_codon:yes gene_type:complete
MSYLLILPLYLLIFAVVPVIAGFLAIELIELLSRVDIKRSKKERELFN